MEFTEYKCPVCDKQFKKGDDIVVCPECGAPHHRECYEKKVIVILQTNTVLIFLLKGTAGRGRTTGRAGR